MNSCTLAGHVSNSAAATVMMRAGMHEYELTNIRRARVIKHTDVYKRILMYVHVYDVKQGLGICRESCRGAYDINIY